LNHLETVHIASDWNLNLLRFPVQWVNRPNNRTNKDLHDFAELSGQIASGIVRRKEVVGCRSGVKTTVRISGSIKIRCRKRSARNPSRSASSTT